MQTQSLIFMLVSETIIVSLTVYFFLKVLFTKKKNEPDSYSENN
jgi:hypothetical protein